MAKLELRRCTSLRSSFVGLGRIPPRAHNSFSAHFQLFHVKTSATWILVIGCCRFEVFQAQVESVALQLGHRLIVLLLNEGGRLCVAGALFGGARDCPLRCSSCSHRCALRARHGHRGRRNNNCSEQKRSTLDQGTYQKPTTRFGIRRTAASLSVSFCRSSP